MALKSLLLASSRWISRLTAEPGQTVYDLVLPTSEWDRGWIFGGIAREINRHFDGSCKVCRFAPLFTGLYFKSETGRTAPPHIRAMSFAARLRSRRLPRARTYFFYSPHVFHLALLWNPHIWRARKVVFYTHAEEPHHGPGGVLDQLRGADFLVTMNQHSRDVLVADGWPADRIAVVLCGADPEVFLPHERSHGAVGLCSAYYPRKAPGRVLEVVAALPARRFILLGRNWHQWERFGELLALPNFEYVEVPYEDYPRWYAKFDVFLSVALNEGGPIPLIEAMLSNCVPVASRTGFAPDIIEHRRNGFTFDIEAPIDHVASLIEAAFRIRVDVRATVEHLTWERFTQELSRCLAPGQTGVDALGPQPSRTR